MLWLLVISLNAWSLPIDWHGQFGVDTNTINTFRKTEQNNPPIGNGSQAIPDSQGSRDNANFQSYILQLQPSIIVNDSVTINGELTTGPSRGGFLGDSSTNKDDLSTGQRNASYGNQLYFHNFSRPQSNLILTQFYMNLFAHQV